jgi:hypothetical protein
MTGGWVVLYLVGLLVAAVVVGIFVSWLES